MTGGKKYSGLATFLATTPSLTIERIEAEYGVCKVKGCGRILESWGCAIHARGELLKLVHSWESSADAKGGNYPPDLTEAEKFALGWHGSF